MYVPTHFKEDNPDTLLQYIQDYSLGTLIIADEHGIEANHIPFVFSTGTEGSPGVLQCHVARSNPVWQRLQNGDRVLVVFQGPDAYVSPAWYPTKEETGRVVPTWNYLAVHAEGSARVIHDADWLKHQLHQLTNRHESQMPQPWSVDDAPADFTDQMVMAIVGLEINIEKLTGKLKASQNQPERNKAGVKAGLASTRGDKNNAMARFIPE